MEGSAQYRQYLEEHPPKPVSELVKTRPQWRPFRDPARIWLNADGLPSACHDQDTEASFLVRQAVKFMKKNRGKRFCLWIGFHEPHSPFQFPVEFRGKYDPRDMPLPDTSPEDDRWIPRIFKDLTDAEKRGIIASYYTSVEYLDNKVGEILHALEDLGLMNETLVIYIGDQGYLLGHHKRFEKHMMWEEAVRAPLIILAGDRWGRKKTVNALVEFIDLAPTVLEALGVEFMDNLQGKSLVPVMDGRSKHHKHTVFTEFLCDNKAMVRDERWKYIFTSGKRDLGQGYATGNPPPGITHRLYDLQSDPGEFRNIAGDAGFREVLDRMQRSMVRIFMETDPRSARIPEALSVEERLVWFCEPPDKNPDLNAK